MKQYDTYKDSGIAWIGEIPSEWEVKKNKYLLTQMYSGGTPTASEEKFYTENGVPFVSISDMSTTEYIEVTKKSLTKYGINNKKLKILPQGTILYSIYATVGAISELMVSATISQAILALNLNNSINKQFYKYNLSAMKDYIYSQANGNTQFNLNAEKVWNFVFCFPPLSEQQSIATFLDTNCGEIDALISLQEEMISELQAYKQSVITEAVTKGLNPHAKMKDSGVEWIGEIPEHWNIVPIKHIKSKDENSFVDGPFGSNLKSQHFIENGDVYVIESGFVTTGKFIFKPFKEISFEHFETIKRSECKAGDIIIAKIGAKYGMGAELPILDKPSVVSGNSLKIKLDNNKILNDIFVFLLMTAKAEGGYRDLVQENAQPALSLGGLNNFKLPVPPLHEQHSIATYLDEKTSQIDSLISLKQEKIEELKDYKKSIIYEYVTGKKRV